MKLIIQFPIEVPRGGSRTAATFKMERFVIIVNGFQLDFAAALDPPLVPLTFQMPIPDINIRGNVTYYSILKLLNWYLLVERNPKTFRYKTVTVLYMAPKTFTQGSWNYQNERIFKNQNVSVMFAQNIWTFCVFLIMLVLIFIFSYRLRSIVVKLIDFLSYCLVGINWLVKLWKVNIE